MILIGVVVLVLTAPLSYFAWGTFIGLEVRARLADLQLNLDTRLSELESRAQRNFACNNATVISELVQLSEKDTVIQIGFGNYWNSTTIDAWIGKGYIVFNAHAPEPEQFWRLYALKVEETEVCRVEEG
jgi:hypothetical protein